MNRKQKSNPVSMIVMMAVIGVVISVFSGDFSIGRVLEGLEISSTEVLLEYLTFGLGFLALTGVFIFFFIRAAKDDKDKEYYWNFEENEDQGND